VVENQSVEQLAPCSKFALVDGEVPIQFAYGVLLNRLIGSACFVQREKASLH
jgi:hypothetical protein